MYAQNAAMRAADLWRLPADPLVQVMTSLDSVERRSRGARGALLRAPQIKSVTGVERRSRGQRSGPLRALARGRRGTGEAPEPVRRPTISSRRSAPISSPGGRSSAAAISSRALARRRESSGSARHRRRPRDGACCSAGRRPARRSGKSCISTERRRRRAHGERRALAFEIIGVVDRAPLAFMTFGAKAHRVSSRSVRNPADRASRRRRRSRRTRAHRKRVARAHGHVRGDFRRKRGPAHVPRRSARARPCAA